MNKQEYLEALAKLTSEYEDSVEEARISDPTIPPESSVVGVLVDLDGKVYEFSGASMCHVANGTFAKRTPVS